jgi:acetylornithine deacetylase/succinyl-diaminopimelate desuccinylase-like protein
VLDLLSWAKRFVATPSVSREGNAGMAQLASELLRAVGLEPRTEHVCDEGVEQYNVIADLVPSGKARDAKGVLLVTHLDTVPPGDLAAWTATGGDPFKPTVDGDRLYGLGSADAKVDMICKAAALASLDRTRLCRPIRVLGTFGEEIGLRGARHFTAQGGARGFGFALVGEPSELAVIRAHKGYAVFEARVRLPAISALGVVRESCCEGTAAHSSTPHLGRNAIDLALERLAQPDVRAVIALEGGGSVNVVPDRARLAACVAAPGPCVAVPGFDVAPLVAFQRAFGKRLAELRERTDPDFDPGYTVGNLGAVTLREGVCTFRFDLRPIPGVAARDVVKPLEAIAEIVLVRENPGLLTAPDAELVRAVTDAQHAVGLPRRVATKATSTEAGVISEQGLEVIVLGAGPSVGNVHKPNEHTRIPELAAARDLYTEVLRTLCVEAPSCS